MLAVTLVLSSNAELELGQQSMPDVVDCMQYHGQAWEQPVSNQQSPHRDSDTLAAFALQSGAQLELEQRLMLALALVL